MSVRSAEQRRTVCSLRVTANAPIRSGRLSADATPGTMGTAPNLEKDAKVDLVFLYV